MFVTRDVTLFLENIDGNTTTKISSFNIIPCHVCNFRIVIESYQ